jgi:hypothetical protein
MRNQISYKLVGVFVIGLITGALLISLYKGSTEGFTSTANCNQCGAPGCPPVPDMSKYVLKTSIPAPSQCPDMTLYMLKTECPPVPDLSQYVLKSSIPNPEPVIIDNSQCGKECGECPACPRPRCPITKCPEPKACPACPEARCAPCPEPDIKCKATYEPGNPVRPMLASTSTFGF